MHWDSRVSINVSNRLKYNSKSCFRVHKTLFAIIWPNNNFFCFISGHVSENVFGVCPGCCIFSSGFLLSKVFRISLRQVCSHFSKDNQLHNVRHRTRRTGKNFFIIQLGTSCMHPIN